MTQATPGNISRLENQVSSLQSVSQHISMEVQKVGTRQEMLSTEMLALRNQLLQYFEEDKRVQAVQVAETRLGNVRQELDVQYGHYATIRRRATGILQAVDLEMVSDDVIQHTTEDLMMDAPRYWLAPALVAIAAWCRRSMPLVQRASGEAISRDPSKAALFFALVMRRQQNADAVGWLTHYVERQKPSELTREFVIVLDAVTAGAFGPGAVSNVKRTLDRWMVGFAQQPGIEDEQAAAWRNQLEGLKGSTTFTYPTLQTVCPLSDQLIDSLARVRSHERIASYFAEIFSREIPRDLDLEEKVDDILTKLVSNFDDEELPLRRREIEYQAVIDLDGDIVQAKEQAARVGAALEEMQTFPQLLVAAAFHPAEAGTTFATQRLATALCKPWLVQGYDVLAAEIRQGAMRTVPLQIGTWSASAGHPIDDAGLARSLEVHCDAQTEAEVQARKQSPFGLGALALGVLLVLAGVTSLNIFVIVLGLAGCGFGYYTVNKTRVDREEIRRNGDQRKKQAAATLRDALAELVDYRTEWQREDNKAVATRELLTSLDPSTVGFADRRQVS